MNSKMIKLEITNEVFITNALFEISQGSNTSSAQSSNKLSCQLKLWPGIANDVELINGISENCRDN